VAYRAAMDADLIFAGGTVIDGTGGPAVRADVAVADGRIVAVGPDLELAGGRRLDVADAVVAPGFVDAHTHDDFALLIHPDMAFKVRGGVTTCVVGNCGMGAAPFGPASTTAAAFHPGARLEPWDGYAGYLDRLEAHPPAVNAAVLVGHGTVRAQVLGRRTGPPSDTALERLAGHVSEGMAAGCIGMSTGLIYEPGRHAATDELVALAEVVAGHGGLYASHLRNEGDRLLEALAEAIDIGRRAQVPVVISHLKATGRANWGRVADALALIDSAVAEGLTVAADQYPYTAGSTVLAALVEQGSFDGDGGGLGRTEPEAVVIASAPDVEDRVGLSIAELADRLGSGPADAARRQVADEPRTTVVLHTMSEDDVRTVLAHPGIMIGSDGLPTLEGRPHPRLYGTFARVLGRYARDQGVLSLEEAVHRMTGRPAAVFGLAGRGVVAIGSVADLTVFDPSAVLDLGTYDEPHLPPAGIRHVLVGGEPVVFDGRPTGARPGRVLRAGG
jgi:N-acyl-D-amino-acid deacylase